MLLNRVRLTLMIIAIVLMWMGVCGVIGALLREWRGGLVVGGFIGIVYCGLTYLASEKFALDLYEATPLDSLQAPRLYEMVEELSAQVEIEPPLIHLVPLNAPNALAVTGRDGNVILAVTQGLTQTLEREEVRAVLALLIARILRGDVATWTVAATLAGVPLHGARSAGVNNTLGDRLSIDPVAGMTLPGKFLLSLVIPPSALALRIAFQKPAILAGDDEAARLTGDPKSLASALAKIESSLPISGWGVSGYNPATALLFVVPPLPPPILLGESAPFWVRAQRAFPFYHPTASERGQRLREGQAGAAAAR